MKYWKHESYAREFIGRYKTFRGKRYLILSGYIDQWEFKEYKYRSHQEAKKNGWSK